MGNPLNPETDIPDIPASLKRDASNKAPFMTDETATVVQETEKRPAKSVKAKSNGQAPKAVVKAADKPKVKKAVKVAAKAKTAPKATVKAHKVVAKTKAVKTKVAKPRVSKAELDAWGFRKGSAKSQAVAMYARKSGATLGEVKAVVGSVQLNCLVLLEEQGKKVERVKEKRGDERAVTRYWLKS